MALTVSWRGDPGDATAARIALGLGSLAVPSS